MACNLSFVAKNGVLKVIASHVHFKSGSVLKTVLDKEMLKKGLQTGSDMPYGHLIATTMIILGIC